MRNLLKNFLAILGGIFLAMIVFFRLTGSTHGWNREIGTDSQFEFNVAYVDLGDGKMAKFRITSWRDFDNSDQLQFTTLQGVTFLTGASRCILTNEKGE